MRTLVLCLPAVACVLPQSAAVEDGVARDTLTLKEIMADPDWIGRAPASPYWSDDSRSVYYSQEREGSSVRDLFRIDLATDETHEIHDTELAAVDVDGGSYDRLRRRRVFVRNGDLFLSDRAGSVMQLTRTSAAESSPAFLLDGERIQFRRDRTLFVRELATGLELEPAVLELSDDPAAEEDEEPDYLEAQQGRLIETLGKRKRLREEDEEVERARHAADPTRAPLPFYLGDGREVAGSDLSGDGRWLLLRTRAKEERDEDQDEMPEYVTDSSWVETRRVRPHVGKTRRSAMQLELLDLWSHERFLLDLAPLPQLTDDPLAWLTERDEAAAEGAPEGDADAETEPEPRGVSIRSVAWAPDASTVAFLARSNDNKDRWIAHVDLHAKAVVPIHHLRDEAWINWRFSEMGWFDDSSGLWFTSEETGYSQLYAWASATGDVRALTEGSYEIDSVEASGDGSALYFRANATHPGIHDVYRFTLPDGPLEAITDLGGRTRGDLSPDGKQLLLVHSRPLAPPELYLQPARPGATARRLTHTVSEAFSRVDWVAPRVVAVPSRHGAPIYTRVYVPDEPADEPRPVVAFVHGAGYLQNAHLGWSGYFREFMFHTLLVQHGYVVVDADYRASAGYGRDWRTAIYRGMGPPELDDYEDVLAWLDTEEDVDLERVGIYGGSYGGFVTLMGLFQRPDIFACGAALRPVTDWAHYNHGYTSNILNTPELDPEAYEASSPIEFADGLADPLLVCHGLVDDNVLAKDSIRLAQRLIELEKEDWELALFPVEPHGFREPSSWLDEYRRIFALFETSLRR